MIAPFILFIIASQKDLLIEIIKCLNVDLDLCLTTPPKKSLCQSKRSIIQRMGISSEKIRLPRGRNSEAYEKKPKIIEEDAVAGSQISIQSEDLQATRKDTRALI